MTNYFPSPEYEIELIRQRKVILAKLEEFSNLSTEPAETFEQHLADALIQCQVKYLHDRFDEITRILNSKKSIY